MKKISVLLVVVLLLSLAASACAEREFVDSTGRTVTVPDEIDKVAVSGPMTQIILFALCPEKLAGISAPWDEAAVRFIPAKYDGLPVLGQLYGHGHALRSGPRTRSVTARPLSRSSEAGGGRHAPHPCGHHLLPQQPFGRRI